MRGGVEGDKTSRGEGTARPLWPHTGAMLTGGASRRMGEPKVAVTLPNGEIMGERIATLLSTMCKTVVLLGSGEDLPPRLRALPLIPDRWRECGPLGGLEALLASGRDTEYLLLPCDLPLLSLSLLLSLVSPTDSAPALLRLPGKKRPEPFPLLIPASAHQKLVEELRAGRRSARAFLESLSPRIVEAPAGREMCFQSLNTPEQIQDPSLPERLIPTEEGIRA